jgi:hypothetical protein
MRILHVNWRGNKSRNLSLKLGLTQAENSEWIESASPPMIPLQVKHEEDHWRNVMLNLCAMKPREEVLALFHEVLAETLTTPES